MSSADGEPPEWVNEFRRQLESVGISSVFTMERSEIVSILKVLVDHIGPLLAETKYTSTETEIINEHVVVSQLRHLILGLEDLDRGLVHQALKAALGQANAALSAEQRQYDRLLLEAVEIPQKAIRVRRPRRASARPT
jgi:hypothetical protein